MKIVFDVCRTCNGPDHPKELNLKLVREKIPHTLGDHRPNLKEVLLCNGHCGWGCGECNSPDWLCLNCGYVECHGCAEDFFMDIEEKLMPELEGHGTANYCRCCGKHETYVELDPINQQWLCKQIGIMDEVE